MRLRCWWVRQRRSPCTPSSAPAKSPSFIVSWSMAAIRFVDDWLSVAQKVCAGEGAADLGEGYRRSGGGLTGGLNALERGDPIAPARWR